MLIHSQENEFSWCVIVVQLQIISVRRKWKSLEDSTERSMSFGRPKGTWEILLDYRGLLRNPRGKEECTKASHDID